MSRTLIVYYSRRGENYVGGVIKKLQQGNTECVAGKIAALTGADSFQIETTKAYPAGYTEMTEVAMQELQSRERPALTGQVENMEQYDTIILGYPERCRCACSLSWKHTTSPGRRYFRSVPMKAADWGIAWMISEKSAPARK